MHITEHDLIPIPEAARMLEIESKRLLGYCLRNKVGDPISDGREVYGWSCKTLASKVGHMTSNHSTVATHD